MNPYFLIFEFGAIFAFLAVLFHERKNAKMIEVLTLAFVYGILLEALNIHMSQGIYVYNPVFILQIFDIPLAIGAGWAIIYYLAQGTAKRFNLSWWQSPFLMMLIALSYDLAMDAIAIRLGFWSWKIPLDQEWFGVPYDNFFGWLAVVWTFALFINLSFQDFVKEKYRKIVRYLAPAFAALLLGMEIMVYINLSAVLSGKFTWGEALALYNGHEYDYAYIPEVQKAKGGLLLFIVLSLSVLCFFWIKKAKAVSAPKDSFAIYTSLAIHSMFFFFLITSGIYEGHPIFIIISLLTCAFVLLLESKSKR
ncbi:MAG: carotenoid biosynthesis protein [Candidatus Paceibacterota bacterium]